MHQTPEPNSSLRQPRHARRCTVLLIVCAALTVAGCGGSALAPEDVLAANQALQGRSGNAVGGAPGTGAVGQLPPSGSVAVPDGSPGTGDKAVPVSGGSGPTTAGTSRRSGGSAPAGGTVTRGSCTGFRNQTGITDTAITLGNAADISGPIPGMFTSAQQAAKAYVAYFNATNPGGICGRRLVLQPEDTRTDAGADNQAYTRLCDTTFAAIGSLSAFDAGGAATAEKCGLPDLRTLATQSARNNCATCFGIQSSGPTSLSSAIFSYWSRKVPAATKKAAFLYINAGAAAENAKLQIDIGKKLGMNWLYTSGVDVADFNYGPYVQQMKSKGIEFAYFLGAYQQSVRFAQAMQQANFTPKVAYYSPAVYDQGFIKTGGSSVEGATMYINFTPLEENQKELNLYKQWLAQVAPGAQPSYFGIYGWSAGKLFVEKALALGGKLDRASLVAALRGTTGWTGGGMHSAMPVGSKLPPSCIRFLKVQGGRFVPADSGRFTCSGITYR